MKISRMARLLAVGFLLVSGLGHGAGAIGFGMRRSSHLAHDLRRGSIKSNIQNTTNANTIEPEFVEIPLDHFGSFNGTYYNRFWVSESGYRKGGPVFMYDVGESDGFSEAQFILQDGDSFFKQMVDEFGGIGIVWEHRFYGRSSPVEITTDTKPDAFKYLTTEQSLADVKTFADQFSRGNISDVDLTPNGSPWVFVGGSYPGMRAAFMRKFYPETIYASFASSAPVEAQIDMSTYFEPIYQGMNANGWGNCTNDIHAAITHMDQIMEDPEHAAALKIKFLGRNADRNSNGVFAYALGSIFNGWQSYGIDGGDYTLRQFCDWMESNTASNITAPAEGWAKRRGAAFAVDRWASWPQLANMVNDATGSDCEGPGKNDTRQNSTAAPDCVMNDLATDPSWISWTWQYCTQWGFFQSANIGPTQLLSKYYSLEYIRDSCHRQFPNATASLLPYWPETNKTNAHFGGWNIRPSNVYWSGGQFDPWRTLSPLSDRPGAPHPILAQNASACGMSTDQKHIFGYVMPNAEHVFDFDTAFTVGETSRQNFINALKGWLKCWKPSQRGV